MVTEQYNDKDELVREVDSDVYDFRQQGGFVAKGGYTFKKGDRFKVKCYYHTQNGEVFGKGSYDEMCIDFVSLFHFLLRTQFSSFLLSCFAMRI